LKQKREGFYKVISFYGVLLGLAVAVILIILKLSPVAALLSGAVIGSLVGGATLAYTLQHVVISGTASVMGVNARIIAAGVLAGVLIESGAAETIARAIVDKLGEKRSVLAIALAGMIITAAGIFITITVIMLSPLALSVGQKAKISKASIILALSGGAKAGNIISPNPNTVAVAETFGISLSDAMIGGFIPAVIGLAAVVLLAGRLIHKGGEVKDTDVDNAAGVAEAPSLAKAICAPLIAIALLMISPVGNIFNIDFMRGFQIDAFFILPVSAVTGAIIMGKAKKIIAYTNSGITRMMPIVLLLAGAGAIGGLITGSQVPSMLTYTMSALGIPSMLLAPLSGSVMAFAAGSAVTGTILASSAFAETILGFGVAPVAGAVMLHAGAMFIDVMPHGNIFLGSKESMKMEMGERLKIVPYEAAVGGVMVLAATVM